MVECSIMKDFAFAVGLTAGTAIVIIYMCLKSLNTMEKRRGGNKMTIEELYENREDFYKAIVDHNQKAKFKCTKIFKKVNMQPLGPAPDGTEIQRAVVFLTSVLEREYPENDIQIACTIGLVDGNANDPNFTAIKDENEKALIAEIQKVLPMMFLYSGHILERQ